MELVEGENVERFCERDHLELGSSFSGARDRVVDL